MRLNQYGVRQGGPIVIPGLYDGRGKAFFFLHYEELRLPNNASRVRDVLHPSALDGWFRYNATVGGQQVVRESQRAGSRESQRPDRLDRPGRDAHPGGYAGVASEDRRAQRDERSTRDGLRLAEPGRCRSEHQPAIRIDYNLTDRHRLTGTFNKLWQDRDPDQLNEDDRQFPDAPNYRPHGREAAVALVNAAFEPELHARERAARRHHDRRAVVFRPAGQQRPPDVRGQDGYAIDFDANIGLTNWHVRTTPSSRSAYQYTHRRDGDLAERQAQPSRSAAACSWAVPGRIRNRWCPASTSASTRRTIPPRACSPRRTSRAHPAGRAHRRAGSCTRADRSGRRGHRAGRARCGDQPVLVPREAPSRGEAGQLFGLHAGLVADDADAHAQRRAALGRADAVRSRSTTRCRPPRWPTCAASPVSGSGGIYNACNFYRARCRRRQGPGVRAVHRRGSRGYNTDWNNFAPNVGVAWRPNVEQGWLRTLLGDPEQATLRGGYSVAYDRQGIRRVHRRVRAQPGEHAEL